MNNSTIDMTCALSSEIATTSTTTGTSPNKENAKSQIPCNNSMQVGATTTNKATISSCTARGSNISSRGKRTFDPLLKLAIETSLKPQQQLSQTNTGFSSSPHNFTNSKSLSGNSKLSRTPFQNWPLSASFKSPLSSSSFQKENYKNKIAMVATPETEVDNVSIGSTDESFFLRVVNTYDDDDDDEFCEAFCEADESCSHFQQQNYQIIPSALANREFCIDPVALTLLNNGEEDLNFLLEHDQEHSCITNNIYDMGYSENSCIVDSTPDSFHSISTSDTNRITITQVCAQLPLSNLHVTNIVSPIATVASPATKNKNKND